MRVPAVCDNCGTIFPSSFEVENSINISFSGCTTGPCPACRGQGHIPDGIYNFIGNTIELLSGSSRTVAELERLAAILKQAREKGASLEEVTNEIEAHVPELLSIKDILPKSRTELYAFIGIIITTIGLLLAQLSKDETQRIEINNNNVINNIYQQAPVPSVTQTSNKAQTQNKKIGRNEPCPCGSGKKYKKCCSNKK